MLTHVSIEGYRRLKKVDLPLSPLNVMIGANGAGKTSMLDVIALLSSAANGRLDDTIARAGGIRSIVSLQSSDLLGLQIASDACAPEPLRYRLELEPAAAAYAIRNELLWRDSGPDQGNVYVRAHRGNVEYFDAHDEPLPQQAPLRPLEPALSQAPHAAGFVAALRRDLEPCNYYHALDVGPRAPVRLPQQLHPTQLPGPNGESLAASLFTLRETGHDRYEEIEHTLRVAFPQFERLEFHPVAAGSVMLGWKDRSQPRAFYASELSEGTLRFLWLTTLLSSPGIGGLTLIDEPEVSLHPEMMMILAGMLRDAAFRTQLFVATHSDRLVGYLEPAEVVVMDIAEDGTSSLRRADTLDIGHWLRDYTLDDLWSMGVIGGRAS